MWLKLWNFWKKYLIWIEPKQVDTLKIYSFLRFYSSNFKQSNKYKMPEYRIFWLIAIQKNYWIFSLNKVLWRLVKSILIKRKNSWKVLTRYKMNKSKKKEEKKKK
jgi:hypothetical protein